MPVSAWLLPVCTILCPSSGVGRSHPLEEVPWIGDGQQERSGADWYLEDPAPEFRAEFVLPHGVKTVNVSFACAGFGSFSVNGKYMMNPDGLDAFWSVYDKTIYAVTRTVGQADGLRPGPATNAIHVLLGNGFYNLPPLKFWGRFCFRDVLPHGRPCFKLFVDGVENPLAWKWRKTGVLRNCVYLGTEVDATHADDSFAFQACAVCGPKGVVAEWPGSSPQMGVHERHEGASAWLREGSVQIVDFGVNASGVPEFLFRREVEGTRIEILYGEKLNADGSVNVLTQTAGQIKRAGMGGVGAPDIACQRDVYICRGRDDLFRPAFTWHVFRYAEVRGARRLLKPCEAVRRIRSMVSIRDDPNDGKWGVSADPRLRRLHEVCRRTFQSNLIGGVQSDCPGRERLGYGADIAATCDALCLNFDMRDIYLKILRDFADEASSDGWITETAPYVGIADFSGAESAGEGRAVSAEWSSRAAPVSWAMVVPVLMESLMRHYPDVRNRALSFYPVCARYVRLLDAKFPTGVIPTCIGDHEALDRAPNDCMATAHWHRFVALTAGFADMLGLQDAVAELRAIDGKIVRAFRDRFIKDGVVANGSQSAQATGLFLGLVPDDQIEAAERRLLEAIEERGCAVSTGIFSTRYMLMYLSEHGHHDVAMRLVLHEGFPGWMHMLDRGATTLWETWKESDDVYSNCHPMFGSVDEWILRYAQR